MNSIKKRSRSINSNKNKLNSKISWQKISYLNSALPWLFSYRKSSSLFQGLTNKIKK